MQKILTSFFAAALVTLLLVPGGGARNETTQPSVQSVSSQDVPTASEGVQAGEQSYCISAGGKCGGYPNCKNVCCSHYAY
jgi:hypothetical protein